TELLLPCRLAGRPPNGLGASLSPGLAAASDRHRRPLVGADQDDVHARHRSVSILVAGVWVGGAFENVCRSGYAGQRLGLRHSATCSGARRNRPHGTRWRPAWYVRDGAGPGLVVDPAHPGQYSRWEGCESPAQAASLASHARTARTGTATCAAG